MEKGIFDLSRKVDKCITAYNPEVRDEIYNHVLSLASDLNEQNTVLGHGLHCFNTSMNIDININKYQQIMGELVEDLIRLCQEYCKGKEIKNPEEEINKRVGTVKKEIEEAMDMITQKLILLLKKM